MEKELNGKMYQIPEHVAIILDGNGRWAKKTSDAEKYGTFPGSQSGGADL